MGRRKEGELIRRLKLYGAFGLLRSQFGAQWGAICVEGPTGGWVFFFL